MQRALLRIFFIQELGLYQTHHLQALTFHSTLSTWHNCLSRSMLCLSSMYAYTTIVYFIRCFQLFPCLCSFHAFDCNKTKWKSTMQGPLVTLKNLLRSLEISSKCRIIWNLCLFDNNKRLYTFSVKLQLSKPINHAPGSNYHRHSVSSGQTRLLRSLWCRCKEAHSRPV